MLGTTADEVRSYGPIISSSVPSIVLTAECAAVLVIILVAGLWPFHDPRNEVRWLSDHNGLAFGRYGSIVSAGSFTASDRDGSCSLEIWLDPKRRRASGTILAFYQPERQVTSFSIRQSLGDLALQRPKRNEFRRRKNSNIYIDDVFSSQEPVLVTIAAAGSAGTSIFVDGVLVKKVPDLVVSSRDFTGRLIVGNSPITTDEWSGQLSGLAIYGRELTTDEVSQHFSNWRHGKYPAFAKSESVVAVYLLNEGRGNVAHNLVDPATDLLIPQRFFLLHAQFLERPWDEFRPDLNYWKDVGINVAGFIPLGFFFYAYLFLLRRIKHPVAITVALGFAVSLTIEVSQAYLPTRDSGMTDLITNTMGTAIGVMMFKHRAVNTLLVLLGLHSVSLHAANPR